MERLIEIEEGFYPDGFPKSRWKHENCGASESYYADRSVDSVCPYCPYCGKKITHVKLVKDDFDEYLAMFLEELGFICE